jgi:chloramphenicol 3-O-phosphotransferase
MARRLLARLSPMTAKVAGRLMLLQAATKRGQSRLNKYIR